ncbi:hypothetical protein [Candidatus Thalassolituus haligoni]|uniref:condensin complex protein MksE n=1 Tax=Candidatus Thalassolituus haligoni TaxID=3100113 RepID=UPI003515C597|tara:strand:- start:2320 stop:2973 length:654 start_codon:yes stop_codon:yes gene_type:complete
MSNDVTEGVFSTVVEALLMGRFICEFTDRVAFDYLQKEVYRDNVNDYLNKIGRKLQLSSAEDVFYCAYSTIDCADRKSSVKSQFNTTINQLEPLVRWLKLAMSALQKEESIQPGDTLRQGELLTAIEGAQTLADDLAKIVRSGHFATTRATPRDQLNHIMTKLVDGEYLKPNEAKSTTYTATGKWSYLYDVLDFIHIHESMGSEDDEPREEQQELML